MSFQLAWYKTHYPTHFYTVMLNFLDEDNVFTASDFEKSVYDLQKELEGLLAQADDDYYWSDNYHNKRIRAIELLLDIYLHGHIIVPCYDFEKDDSTKCFIVGNGITIRTTYEVS